MCSIHHVISEWSVKLNASLITKFQLLEIQAKELLGQQREFPGTHETVPLLLHLSHVVPVFTLIMAHIGRN